MQNMSAQAVEHAYILMQFILQLEGAFGIQIAEYDCSLQAKDFPLCSLESAQAYIARHSQTRSSTLTTTFFL